MILLLCEILILIPAILFLVVLPLWKYRKDLDRVSSNNKYTIQKANHRDIQKIFRLLENMFEDTKDSFLPFGFHLAIRVSLPFWLLLIIEIVALNMFNYWLLFSPIYRDN